jgi:hypothetical protein
MEVKNEITIFMNSLTAIQKELQLKSDVLTSTPKLKEILDCIDNYQEQLSAINSSESTLFNNNENNSKTNQQISKQTNGQLNKIDSKELKIKLLFKIGKLVNEKFELLKIIL